MNAILRARPLRTAPILRASHKPCLVRPFHPSKSTQLVDAYILLAHDALQGVHSVTGLPWAASIPLTAMLVRLLIAMPLAAYSRHNMNLQKEVIPILTGWRGRIRLDVIKWEQENGTRVGPAAAESAVQQTLEVEKKRLHKKFGVKPWTKYVQILTFPVWLAFMDALRRMCGMDSIVDSFRWWYRSTFVSKKTAALAAASEQSGEVPTALVPIEPSFAIEGALWFPDLTVMDPALVLPFALSGALLLSINYGRTRSFDLARMAGMSGRARASARFFAALRVGLNVFALTIAPMSIASGFPSAIMIYWISGSLMATIQMPLLNRLLPSKPMVKPCFPMAIVPKQSRKQPSSREALETFMTRKPVSE